MKTQKAISTLFLFVKWISVFYILTILTKWTFAPWDTVDPIYRTVTMSGWETTLNNFFELGWGKFLFSVPVVMISMKTWWHTQKSSWHSTAQLALSNGILLLAIIASSAISNPLNQLFFSPPEETAREYYVNYVGYHRTIIPAILWGLISIWWFRFQHRIAHNQQKAKREDYSYAKQKRHSERIHRLSDQKTITKNPELSANYQARTQTTHQ
ncbi:MAG: hypothetical protein AAF846_15600 [Chloroflexota bacterium]